MFPTNLQQLCIRPSIWQIDEYIKLPVHLTMPPPRSSVNLKPLGVWAPSSSSERSAAEVKPFVTVIFAALALVSRTMINLL